MSDTVPITMNEADFRLLTCNAMRWAGQHWDEKVQTGRFEIQGTPDIPPGLHWKMAYWLGGDYTTVILARSFLAARGFGSQAVADLACDGEWVILTDYDDWRAGK